MKTAIIFLLLFALAAAAFFTKPTQAEFKRYVVDQKTGTDKGIIQVSLDKLQADQIINSCTFNNRVLWTNVERDGRTIYTGAFGHWFGRAQVANDVSAVKTAAHVIRTQGK